MSNITAEVKELRTLQIYGTLRELRTLRMLQELRTLRILREVLSDIWPNNTMFLPFCIRSHQELITRGYFTPHVCVG